MFLGCPNFHRLGCSLVMASILNVFSCYQRWFSYLALDRLFPLRHLKLFILHTCSFIRCQKVDCTVKHSKLSIDSSCIMYIAGRNKSFIHMLYTWRWDNPIPPLDPPLKVHANLLCTGQRTKRSELFKGLLTLKLFWHFQIVFAFIRIYRGAVLSVCKRVYVLFCFLLASYYAFIAAVRRVSPSNSNFYQVFVISKQITL